MNAASHGDWGSGGGKKLNKKTANPKNPRSDSSNPAGEDPPIDRRFCEIKTRFCFRRPLCVEKKRSFFRLCFSPLPVLFFPSPKRMDFRVCRAIMREMGKTGDTTEFHGLIEFHDTRPHRRRAGRSTRIIPEPVRRHGLARPRTAPPGPATARRRNRHRRTSAKQAPCFRDRRCSTARPQTSDPTRRSVEICVCPFRCAQLQPPKTPRPG